MSRERRNAQRIVKELRGWGAEEVSVLVVGDGFEFSAIVRTKVDVLRLRHRESFVRLAATSEVGPIAESIFASWFESVDRWHDPEQRLYFLEALGL